MVRMADTATPPANGLVIPAETKAAFGELVALILSSESMNDEERQYWINILPIMTPEQVANLHDILQSEKSQLAEIDKKYATEIDHLGDAQAVAQTEADRREKRMKRQQAEGTAEAQEEIATEELLKKIQDNPS